MVRKLGIKPSLKSIHSKEVYMMIDDGSRKQSDNFASN